MIPQDLKDREDIKRLRKAGFSTSRKTAVLTKAPTKAVNRYIEIRKELVIELDIGLCRATETHYRIYVDILNKP